MTSYVAAVVALAWLLFVTLTCRKMRHLLFWSLPWSWLYVVWAIAPRTLVTHHLSPADAGAWCIVIAFHLVVASGAGLLTVAAGGMAAGPWWILKREDWRAPATAAGIRLAVGLPVGYLALSSVIEWVNFDRPPGLADLRSAAMTSLPISVVIAVAVWSAGRYARRRSLEPDPLVTRALMLGAATGVVALLLRAPAAATPGPPPEPLTRTASQTTPPLLVVGLDGGNWRVLRPLIDTGRLPVLSGLIATGIHGNVEALWPPFWSTPAWGAILTGRSREELGVYEDLAATVPGLPPFQLPLTLDPWLNPIFVAEFALIRLGIIQPAPLPRDMLNGQPVWERLSDAGTRTAVIRFPFTFPATGQADYVISNRAVTDLWDLVGVQRGQADRLVHVPRDFPSPLRDLLGEQDASAADLEQLFAGLPPQPKPADSLVDTAAVLSRVMGIGKRMTQVAENIIRADSELRLVMFHMSDFDNAGHALWQYRFPDDFPADQRPLSADVTRFGPVLDRYVEHLDRELGRLIDAFPERPNVLIVSDHGQEASLTYPLWKGWHARQGIVVASGPSVARSSDVVDASYFDMVPTILDLSGWSEGANPRGRSLVRPR